MSKVRTHYDNLKVARNAPPEVIRAAYKALGQKHHPDKNKSSSESIRIMKIINESYSVLSDPQTRKAHDAWISQSDSRQSTSSTSSAETQSNNTQKNIFPSIVSGEVYSSQIDQQTLRALKDRISGKNKEQYAIKLEGVVSNFFWLAILPVWFAYLFYDAQGNRWPNSTLYWHAGFTAIFAWMIARNLSWIIQWFSQPFKSYLIITPLYIIKFRLDKVSYWPISAMTDLKATYNYYNGFYTGTSFTITFNGKKEDFFVKRKKAYIKLVENLNRYKADIKTAVLERKFDYFINKNDFFYLTKYSNAPKKPPRRILINTYVFVFVIAVVLLGVAYFINKDNDFSLDQILMTDPFASYKTEPRVSYIRPTADPKGQIWPRKASYLTNYPRLNTGGLSSVTIDNTQNDSDIFVKLKSLTGNYGQMVRVFYVPALDQFKVSNVDAGRYDIRYRDLASGKYARSDPFLLEEIATQAGRQYSDTTLTIYKVVNGNMEMHSLSEAEF
jgi:curved DNA-binding protein CbpA